MTAGLLLGCLVLAGCGGTANYTPRTHFESFTPEQQAEISAGGGNHYRIQDGDILLVAFSYMKELNQEGVVVLPDGSVNLVGVGRLKLAGQTVTEADSLVTAAYSREYRDPGISVVVRETVGRKVYVMGEVKSPGLYALPAGGVDVMGAVAVAGGFTKDAAAGGTVLVRVTPEGYLVQEMDLSGMRDVESIELALVQLQPYDLIFVPRSRMGDFGYFASTVLSGLVDITRIAADIRYLSGGNVSRY